MNWKGSWIWFHGDERPRNSHLFLRKTFDLASVPEAAPVRVCADSQYKLYVNGKFVGRGPVRSHPRWQHYDEYDLAGHLRQGRNVAAALVHHYGEPTMQYHLGRGAFFLDSDFLITDDTWKVLFPDAWCRDLPRMDVQLGFPEVLDISALPEGWAEADYDDSDWQQARVLGPFGTDPWNGLIEREIPHLLEEMIFPTEVIEIGDWDSSEVQLDFPMNIALLMSSEKREGRPPGAKHVFPRPNIHDLLASDVLTPGGKPLVRTSGAQLGFKASGISGHRGRYIAIDFGREVVGYPVIKVSAEKGGVLDMGYSELLVDGKVDPHRGGIRYADRFILKPGEREIETFDKRAFRYMQIDLRDCPGFERLAVEPQPMDLDYAGGVVPTIKGGVRVEFRRGPGFTLDVTVPEGARARVVMPDAVSVGGVQVSGPHVLSRDGGPDGRSVFEIGAGDHHFAY